MPVTEYEEQKTSPYQGKQVLEVMARCAVNRNKAIEKLIVRCFGLERLQVRKKMLEFGAGSGEFIDRFRGHPMLSTYAVEIDEEYLRSLSNRHAAFRTLADLPTPVDFIYTVDVLEHIEDDVDALRSLHEVLVPHGLLLIYVPARPELYSAFDRSIGHHRRYRMKELKSKVVEARFSMRVAKYDDFLGYFASLYNKFTSDGTLNPRAVRIYDRLFVPVTRTIEAVVRPPIGKNILLVAEKM